MYTCMVYYLLWRPLLLTSPTQTCERICSQTSHLFLQVERWDQLERRGTFQSHHKQAAAHSISLITLFSFLLAPSKGLSRSLSLACALSLYLCLSVHASTCAHACECTLPSSPSAHIPHFFFSLSPAPSDDLLEASSECSSSFPASSSTCGLVDDKSHGLHAGSGGGGCFFSRPGIHDRKSISLLPPPSLRCPSHLVK